jgi:hypothetical protein
MRYYTAGTDDDDGRRATARRRTEVSMERAPAMMTVGAIRTPRAAAVAGIIFSVLYAASAVLTGWAIPPGSEDAGTWVHDEAKRNAVTLSLQLLPFAGIAFLWFVGVLRDRIGQHEDRFFATVFLGSGLLFVATAFAAGSVAAGLIGTAADAGPAEHLGSVWPFGRGTLTALATVYGLRMAAVFTISTTTIASRLHLVPRWLALLGYATALSLLFGAGVVPWLELIFPAWVFVLSVHILVMAFHSPPAASGDHEKAARTAVEVHPVQGDDDSS